MSVYLVAVCEITNPNDNFKQYAKRSSEVIARHGGEYVVRGPAAENLKGDDLKGKVVIITKWKSMEHFKEFYNDEEYQNEVAPLREGTGNYHIAVYESPAG